MKNLALTRIQSMKPYAPPLSGRRAFAGLLLDFNERTIAPSANITKALMNFLSDNTLQMYPEYEDLQKNLATYAGVDPNQILLTNGADQGIDVVFRTFTDTNDTVIIPTPSFAMFFQAAQSIGNIIISPVYRKKTLAFPLSEVIQNINASTKLIVICNPNNPTGTLVPTADIETIARKGKNAIILVDEAYKEFSQVSAVRLIRKYPNIVITRTLSKAFGLASLRIGYIIAQKKYIEELIKIRGPYDINMFAQVAAIAALDDIEEMKSYVNEIMTQAMPMTEQFFQTNGIPFYPSQANFILFKPNNATQVANTLKANGILVRPQNKPGIQNTLRITIGRTDQMKQFIKTYERYILKKRDVKKNSYAFLDRDGTLIFEPQDTYQIDTVKQLKILDGVIKGLTQLIRQGYKLIMVSNQDGLDSNNYPLSSFETVQKELLKLFEKNGISFSQICICPHLPQELCNCRKPNLGLITELIVNGDMDMASSFVCGDRKSDKQFAKNLGVRFIPMKTNGNFYNAIQKNITCK